MNPSTAAIIAAIVALVSAITGLGTLGVSLLTARSIARKREVEAVSIALQSLRDDYERLDDMVRTLRIEVRAWRRRFDRVCEQAGLTPDDFITRPLGNREEED